MPPVRPNLSAQEIDEEIVCKWLFSPREGGSFKFKFQIKNKLTKWELDF